MTPKLLIWMNMPSHHQTAFFRAVRESGIDLVVHYYGKVTEERRTQGWEDYRRLPEREHFVDADVASLERCPDWSSRIHIVPGYGSKFLRQLALFLSRLGVPWMHWSEPAFPGIRWWLGYPRKRRYAKLVNAYALGALAIGVMAWRDFLRWGISADKIHLLPYAGPGVTLLEKDEIIAEFSRRFSCSFLYIGTLCKRKGVDILLGAFRRVIDTRPDAGLVLVGLDTMDGAYARLVERLQLSHHVLFRGVLPSAKIGSALASCHVVVLPSRFDGWGMVLSEASSAGKALIATTMCGAAYHFVRDGENGFRVPARNFAALAAAMERYAVQPALAAIHGNISRQIFDEYSPEKNAARLRHILARVSEQRFNSTTARTDDTVSTVFTTQS